MTGRYHGTPMVKHVPLPVDAVHFDRWLALYRKITRRNAGEPDAGRFLLAWAHAAGFDDVLPGARGVVAEAVVHRWEHGLPYVRPGRHRIQQALEGTERLL